MRDPATVLREVFGYPSFRDQQEAIVRHVIAGGDCIVYMPTGGGKSMCFWIPALCRTGVGVVVSPLIALMRDQVESLRSLGVKAGAINSTIGFSEASQIRRAVEQCDLDLLYISPEKLLSPGFIDWLQSWSRR